MMNQLRKHMKVILWVVVLAFVGTIFFVWGMGGSRNKEILDQQSAAVVNDQQISYADFDRLWEQRSQELFSRLQEDPTQEQIKRLRSELISGLIDRALLKQQFDKLGLKIHSQEVAAQIAATPAFQDKGKFSQQKYLAMLQYNRINPADFESEQANALALLKMSYLLRDTSLVTEDQLRAFYLSRTRSLKLQVVNFSWKERAKSVSVPDAKIRDYFEKHKSEYDQPAEVRASHILVQFPENATEEQKLTAKLKAENLRGQIVKGGDFAEVARNNSQDPGSAAQGGDLGFFKAGMMVPEFEKAAFALKTGEMSQPVASTYGYHIIKVTDRREAKPAVLAAVRGKILDVLKEEEARRLMLTASNDFRKALEKTKDLSLAAKASGARLIVTDWVQADGKVPGVENAKAVLDKAFDLAVGKPSAAVGTAEGAAFVQVAAEKYRPFDEAAFLSKRAALLEQFKTAQAEQVMIAWLQNAKTEAKIIDNISQEKAE